MQSNLVGLKIERRRISAALFIGGRLDLTDSRQLPSTYAKALASASRYADWIRRTLRIEGAAIEKSRSEATSWRSKFTVQILAQLRSSGVSIYEVEKDALLSSFGHPPLRHNTELRKVVASIPPILATEDTNDACLDAAAVGLYVQVEKMFREQ